MNQISEATTPDPIDVHVGRQLRLLREKRKISQTAIGEACGVSFQQIQKYERGANRISASVLWKLCQELGVKPNYFFEGL